MTTFRGSLSLSEALERAFETKEGTDLVLSTKEGLIIEAHQTVLAYSPFLLKIFEIPEIHFQNKAHLIFPEFGIQSLKTLLQFLYTGEIFLETGSSTLVEFQNLCKLLCIDPDVKKQKSNRSTRTSVETEGETAGVLCEICKIRCDSRGSLKSHARREHKHKSNSKDEEERDRQKSSTNKNTEERDRQKSSTSKDTEERDRQKSSTSKDTEERDRLKSSTSKDTEERDRLKSSTSKDTDERGKQKSSANKDTAEREKQKCSTSKDTEERGKQKSSTNKEEGTSKDTEERDRDEKRKQSTDKETKEKTKEKDEKRRQEKEKERKKEKDRLNSREKEEKRKQSSREKEKDKDREYSKKDKDKSRHKSSDKSKRNEKEESKKEDKRTDKAESKTTEEVLLSQATHKIASKEGNQSLATNVDASSKQIESQIPVNTVVSSPKELDASEVRMDVDTVSEMVEPVEHPDAIEKFLEKTQVPKPLTEKVTEKPVNLVEEPAKPEKQRKEKVYRTANLRLPIEFKIKPVQDPVKSVEKKTANTSEKVIRQVEDLIKVTDKPVKPLEIPAETNDKQVDHAQVNPSERLIEKSIFPPSKPTNTNLPAKSVKSIAKEINAPTIPAKPVEKSIDPIKNPLNAIVTSLASSSKDFDKKLSSHSNEVQSNISVDKTLKLIAETANSNPWVTASVDQLVNPSKPVNPSTSLKPVNPPDLFDKVSEDTEEIAKFILQSVPAPSQPSPAKTEGSTIVSSEAETEVEVENEESDVAQPEITEAETEAEISEQELIMEDVEDHPNEDDLIEDELEQEPSNMFGFKMPDNFDLPEDFFSQIRSSAKAMPEPNETVNDDPMTTASLILESPLPSSIHLADAATNLEVSATARLINSADATAETGAGGHKMPKLTFQKSEESTSLSSLKIRSVKEELENTRRRLANKFKKEEIEKFDERQDVKRSKNKKNILTQNRPTKDLNRPKKSKDLVDDFIIDTDEASVLDSEDSNSSFIEKDVSSGFEKDKEWDPNQNEEPSDIKETKKQSDKDTEAKKDIRKREVTIPKKKPQKRREERKKRREERKKKYESERGSSTDEDLEEEVVKIWTKRGAKPSALPSNRPRLRVNVQMEAEPMIELSHYKLRMMDESSSEAGEMSKPQKIDKNVVVRFAKSVKSESEKPVKIGSEKPVEKKLKRISRLHSSSSSAEEEQDESSDREKPQTDKESGEAETDTEEDEVEKAKKRKKKYSSNSDQSEQEEEKERKKRRTKEKRKRSSSSSRDSSEQETKSESKQFKRSLSLDASKFGNKKFEKSNSFSRQMSSNFGANKKRLHPSSSSSSFQYNYGLSSENKLLAEKRAKEPEELDKIMKMNFKKKPTSESEHKSDNEHSNKNSNENSKKITAPSSSTGSNLSPGKYPADSNLSQSQVRLPSPSHSIPTLTSWASIATRPEPNLSHRVSVTDQSQRQEWNSTPRQQPGLPVKDSGFSKPFALSRPHLPQKRPPIGPPPLGYPLIGPRSSNQGPTRFGQPSSPSSSQHPQSSSSNPNKHWIV